MASIRARFTAGTAWAVVALLTASSAANAANLTPGDAALVSVTAGGRAGNGVSHDSSMSGSSRYVAFVSEATNLAVGTSAATVPQVYWRDTVVGITLLVSRTSTGAPSTGDVNDVTVSRDGRYVVFRSTGRDLPPIAGQGIPGSGGHVYRFDSTTRTTELLDRTSAGAIASGDTRYPVLSPDGDYVAFSSGDRHFIPADTNGAGVRDVFVRRISTGATLRVNATLAGDQMADGDSWPVAVTPNGSSVFFQTTSAAMGVLDTNGQADIYRYVAATDAVSLVTKRGARAFGTVSHEVSVSDAGDIVAVIDVAIGPAMDAFAIDTTAGTITHIAPGFTLDSYASGVNTSPDGRCIAFTLSRLGMVYHVDTQRLDRIHAVFADPEVTTKVRPSAVAIGCDTVLLESARTYLVPNSDTNRADDVFLWTRS